MSTTPLRLPAFFSRHMVFQRDKPIRVFGQANPGSAISVTLGGNRSSTRTEPNGTWEAELSPLQAGGPYTLNVRCGRTRKSFSDVLIGDLWFCSGQSNMAFPVCRSLRTASVIKKATLPSIRHFQVEKIATDKPAIDVKGEWQVCHPGTVGQFTAVGYYFALEIHARTKVPIGIVHSSWGGTPIEAWLPPAAYKHEPSLRPLKEIEKRLRRPDAIIAEKFRKWEKENVSRDPGNKGESLGWARPDFDDRKWGKLKVPGFWEGQGLAIDGAVWFRHALRIPAAWRGLDLQLDLGTIDDFDETYFNGSKVGTTDKKVANSHRFPRSYLITGNLVGSERVTLAVRIFDQFGSGGFTGHKSSLQLSCPSRPKDKAVPISGRWRYAVEWAVERPSPVPQPPALPEPRAQLSRLYNGMVHGLRRVPIRGFLWYQGEANAYRAAHYRDAFQALIRFWRKAWGDTTMPFYFVQLANFKAPPRIPGDDCWAELREAQAAALTLPDTGMAVAIDAGEAADIHPRDKQKVGKRLALLALSKNYGVNLIAEGPILTKIRFQSRKIELEFNQELSRCEEIRGFAVADRNRKWVWARARTHGKNRVVLSSAEIANPVAVRYGWATNSNCNLKSLQRLPSAPFRTDNWSLSTRGRLWPF